MEEETQRRRWGDGENFGSRLAVVEHQVDDMRENVTRGFETLTRLASRPSWAVVALLTGETAVIAALLSVLAARGLH